MNITENGRVIELESRDFAKGKSPGLYNVRGSLAPIDRARLVYRQLDQDRYELLKNKLGNLGLVSKAEIDEAINHAK